MIVSGWVRAQRLRWAGKLLRGDMELSLPSRIAVKDLELHCEQGRSWGIFMDAPAGYSEEEVLELAQDRDLWRGLAEVFFKLKAPSRSKRHTAID